jgi:diaminohydroxyphosphoribosylaminopyrimidine deaminase/5-amino-6-(5-phosphoribosylamino)uracil reductase
VARVIIARREPWSTAGGGLERIAAAGIETHVNDACAFATEVCAPFVHRLTTGLPWVTVKWAQTLDGALVLPASAGQRWISNEASRRMVHRERGRVDAIMTGVGTVIADDPLLTPRNVRLRRAFRSQRASDLPIRIVIDPNLRTPVRSRLVQTAREHPLLMACGAANADSEAARRLHAGGAEVMGIEPVGGELPLEPLLRQLVATRDITHVLVEAGPGLMSRLFRQRLVNETWVFTAPLRADAVDGLPTVRGMTESASMQLWSRRRRGGDVIARYIVHSP